MIKGIGVDILSIERIDYKIARKVLSSEELEIFNSITNDKLKREDEDEASVTNSLKLLMLVNFW